MYKTVKTEIEKLTKKGISKDFLEDVANMLYINDDGKKATATYIINGLRNNAKIYEDFLNDKNEELVRE